MAWKAFFDCADNRRLRLDVGLGEKIYGALVTGLHTGLVVPPEDFGCLLRCAKGYGFNLGDFEQSILLSDQPLTFPDRQGVAPLVKTLLESVRLITVDTHR